MDVWDPKPTLKLDEPPLAGRSRFLPEADRSVIPKIRCGVLFVMAFWSGSSRVSFGRLKETLARLDPNGILEVVVVDTDGCPDLYVAPELEGMLYGGNGEIAWVSKGKVLGTTRGENPQAYETFTLLLLKEWMA